MGTEDRCVECRCPNKAAPCRIPTFQLYEFRCQLFSRQERPYKTLELISGGSIVSLREDLEHTERESSLGFDKIEDFIDCEVKEADWMGDYLLNGEGEYKYLFIKGRWYVVGGLCESDRVTPLRRPITVT